MVRPLTLRKRQLINCYDGFSRKLYCKVIKRVTARISLEIVTFEDSSYLVCCMEGSFEPIDSTAWVLNVYSFIGLHLCYPTCDIAGNRHLALASNALQRNAYNDAMEPTYYIDNNTIGYCRD